MDVNEARQEIERVQRRTRSNGRWYVAAALIMATGLTAIHIGLIAFPERTADLILPAAVGLLIVIGVAGYRLRVVDRTAAKLEQPMLWASALLSSATIVLNKFLLPEELSVWTVAAGALPALPFLLLAFLVSRR
jgi:hypothetical protein